jgi:FkbM family methyltransferase
MRAADQLGALALAYPHVHDRTVAIDGGANRGDWTDALACEFAHVHCFEPATDMVAVLRDRFFLVENVTVHGQALWNETAFVSVVPDPNGPDKSRWRYVRAGGDVEAVAIDDLNLTSCGLIKLDLEGAEMLALLGARDTLARCRPVLIVECKERLALRFHNSVRDCERYITALGAREAARHGPDRIFAWA